MATLAAPAAPSPDAPTGAQLAARIQTPRRLPARYDGQPLRHLSHSSYSKFLLCPDDWRRHYLLRERTPPSGHIVLGPPAADGLCPPPPSGHTSLGAPVDDAQSPYRRPLLPCGERLTRDQLQDAYRAHWTHELA